MSNVTINVTKWYHFALGVGSIVAMIVSAILWVDARYIHKTDFELANTAAELKLAASKQANDAAAAASYSLSINLQYMIVEGRLESYEQMKLDGKQFTANQQIKYNDYIKQYEYLTTERNRLMLGVTH